MVRNLIILLLSCFLFITCKKEECPAPIPAPIITRTVVWCSNNTVNTHDVYVFIADGAGKQWGGMIVGRYSVNPGCGASDCFTIELPPGTYGIAATNDDNSVTWSASTFVVSSTNSCGSFELQ